MKLSCKRLVLFVCKKNKYKYSAIRITEKINSTTFLLLKKKKVYIHHPRTNNHMHSETKKEKKKEDVVFLENRNDQHKE